ncbi:hypothetical protein K474DRAFT_1218873 [Panus rudis PR-1116 ss-1]|nr:hypothetical protein K474DRAFT_1218873 [Panus rudis PR-1116 ss-1]
MCTKVKKVVTSAIRCGGPNDMLDDARYPLIQEHEDQSEKVAEADRQTLDAFSNVTRSLQCVAQIWTSVQADLQQCAGVLEKVDDKAQQNVVTTNMLSVRLAKPQRYYQDISSVCKDVQDALKLQIPITTLAE